MLRLNLRRDRLVLVVDVLVVSNLVVIRGRLRGVATLRAVLTLGRDLGGGQLLERDSSLHRLRHGLVDRDRDNNLTVGLGRGELLGALTEDLRLVGLIDQRRRQGVLLPRHQILVLHRVVDRRTGDNLILAVQLRLRGDLRVLRLRLRLLRRDLRGRRRSRLGRRRSRRRRRRRLGRGRRGLRGRRRGLRRLVLRDIQTRLIDRNDALISALAGHPQLLDRVVVRRDDRDELVRAGRRDRVIRVAGVLKVRVVVGVPQREARELLEELGEPGVVLQLLGHLRAEPLTRGRQERLQRDVETESLVRDAPGAHTGVVLLDELLDDVHRSILAVTFQRDRGDRLDLVVRTELPVLSRHQRGDVSQLLRRRVLVRRLGRLRHAEVDAPAVAQLVVDADDATVTENCSVRNVREGRLDIHRIVGSGAGVRVRRPVWDHDRPHHDDGHSGEQG